MSDEFDAGVRVRADYGWAKEGTRALPPRQEPTHDPSPRIPRTL